MDALQYTNWAVEVADRVEAIVAKRMNGYPDPFTTPTLELLNAIDARLAAAEAERDALRGALAYYADGIRTVQIGEQNVEVHEAPDDGTVARAALDAPNAE